VAVTITSENSNDVLGVDRETFARASVLVLGLLVAGGWRAREDRAAALALDDRASTWIERRSTTRSSRGRGCWRPADRG